MSIHLHKEIKKINKRVLTLSAMVEESVRSSVKAFTERDESLAKTVINNDELIDSLEIDVEEECLKTLALYQPVAIDLRFIVAVLKINSDLERVGDHSVSIAKRALLINSLENKLVEPFSLNEMIETSILLLKQSIDALINHDSDLAYRILDKGEEVSKSKNSLYNKFIEITKESPENLECNSAYMFVSRYLERISEHAINIAEDVIYMINGEIIRHKE